MNLSKAVKITLAAAAASANTTDVLSSAIDMQGFEGCMFVGSIATANAGNYANVQSSSDNSADTYADLTSTKVVPGHNGDSFLIDVFRPQERYLKLLVKRGASTVTGDVYAVQYGAHKLPTTHATTIDSEVHVSPAEGTA